MCVHACLCVCTHMCVHVPVRVSVHVCMCVEARRDQGSRRQHCAGEEGREGKRELGTEQWPGLRTEQGRGAGTKVGKRAASLRVKLERGTCVCNRGVLYCWLPGSAWGFAPTLKGLVWFL